jgi:DNA repair exonuclease SbcCD ATPase subunit
MTTQTEDQTENEPTVEDLKALIAERDAKLSDLEKRLGQLDEAHGRSKQERTEAKTKLKTFEGLGDPEEVRARLDRLAELEIASNPDDEERQREFLKLQIKRETEPIRNELAQAQKERDQYRETASKLLEEQRQGMIRNVGSEWIAENVHPDAQPHAKLAIGHLLTMDDESNVVSNEFEGIPAGLTAVEALEKLKAKYPSWGLESMGSGSGRASGRGPSVAVADQNPFLEKKYGGGWNMTHQHRMLANDPEKAKALKANAERIRQKAKTGAGR